MSSVRDLKPRSIKAPLALLPARPLRAISAALEYGTRKYAPWNWQHQHGSDDWREAYTSALLRHVTALCDPSEPDTDEESGLHHMAHAGACVLIYLFLAGIDYQKPNDPPVKAEDPYAAGGPERKARGNMEALADPGAVDWVPPVDPLEID